MKMEYCGNCKHWEPDGGASDWGYCTNENSQCNNVVVHGFSFCIKGETREELKEGY